jgi:hypothetical protein
MIAGVTHLTMEAELERGVSLGAELGYEPDFLDEVELPPGFEGIEDSEPRLPLALLGGLPGIRLEVVAHRRQTGRRGAYTGIFRCAPPAGVAVARPEVEAILRQAKTLLSPTCVTMATPGAEAWFDSSPVAGGLAGLMCQASDVRAEAGFWSRFAKAKWSMLGADAACGSVPSPRPGASCELVIMHRDDVPAAYAMNDSGFPSMGVFSTAIEGDCDRAVAAGGKLRAEPIVTSVGGRLLRMALISTPGGAPVELLALQRRGGARFHESPA